MSTASAEPAAVAAADAMLPRPVRVRQRRRELGDVWTLELVAADDRPLPRYEPGQFTMLYAFGVGEIPVSVSGDPADPTRLVQTIRAVGPVSTALTKLAKGDVLGLRGPFGTAWPVDEAAGRDVVVVTGGLGLAPLRPALYRLLAHRAAYGRVALLYGARSPTEILFHREVQAWRQRFDIEVEVTVDHAIGDWHGNVGVVTRLIPRIAVDADNAVALVCGPEVMMRFSIRALQDIGLAPSAIHISMERNMKCAVGLCGHCQFAGDFVCKDGAVLRYDRVARLLALKEI